MDRQIDLLNKTLKRYLKCMVRDLVGTWHDWLALLNIGIMLVDIFAIDMTILKALYDYPPTPCNPYVIGDSMGKCY